MSQDWPEWAAGWEAPREKQQAVVAPLQVAGLRALLDAEEDLANPGTPLPILWHWVALAAWARMSETGNDGHPRAGGFMPPAPYPRRMWLGTTVDLRGQLLVGDQVSLERQVTDIAEKHGVTGTFALVSVTTTVSTTSEVALTETTRFAYRAKSSAPAETPAMPGPVAIDTTPWLAHSEHGWLAHPNPVVLARYSALTANGHRIHYDLPYAQAVEGYPNLLVHGPLMATVLAEVARRSHAGRECVAFSCRALRPYFLGTAARVQEATSTPASLDLELHELSPESDSGPYMSATMKFR
ncbi:MAG TPA: MaoC family dehydratase N-terminal domain-containing protein [Mycobacteriales bacterium]|jgi:3-methylfumaryl-CoA hydratase|nr:MaoC family dehydratase N-terminal domain-containing protein [Mycobacteriales bacterium]